MNHPLLVFSAFNFRDELFRTIHHHENSNEPSRFINELRVDSYAYDDASLTEYNETNLYSCTIRARSKIQFLQELHHLKNLFPVIFVYHETIDAQELATVGSNLAMCPAINDLERVCGLQLNDEQRERYNTLVTQRLEPRPFLLQPGMRQAIITGYRSYAPQPPSPHPLFREAEPRNDLDFIFSPDAPWNQGGGPEYIHIIGGGGGGFQDNDDDQLLQIALDRSRQEEERQQEALSRARVKLQEGWRDVLKKSEDAVPGQPVCVVCLTSHASICLVDCGHQVMCDECVEIMWTRVDVNHACPVCKKECTIITRPIVSKVEEEEAPPPRKKSKKGKIKNF